MTWEVSSIFLELVLGEEPKHNGHAVMQIYTSLREYSHQLPHVTQLSLWQVIETNSSGLSE
jgi:hypothetical protein